MGFRLGVGLGSQRSGGGSGHDQPSAELARLLAAFTTQPSNAHKFAYDRFYKTIKAGPLSGSNIFAKLDAVWAFWAETAQQAGINLINPGTHTISPEASPTFTPGVGYSFNGTTQYLDSNFNPTTAGQKLSQNSISIGVWCERDTALNPAPFGWNDGTDSLLVVPYNASGSNLVVNVAQTTSSIAASRTHAFGLTAGNRSASNAVQCYFNSIATTVTNATQASVALNDHNLFFAHPSTTAFGADSIGGGFVGQSLTANEHRDLFNALAVLRMELMFTLDADLNLTRVGESAPRYLMSTAIFQTFKMLLMESTDGKAWRLLGPNPILDFGENFGASSFIRHNNSFYVAHANDPFGSPTNFTVVRSNNLIDWSLVTHVDCSAVVGDDSNSRVWAPKWFVENDGTVHGLFSGSTNAGTGPFTTYEVHPVDNNDLSGDWSTPVALTGSGIPEDQIDPFIFKEDDGTFRYWYKVRPAMLVEYATSASLFSDYVAGETGDWADWGDELEAPEEVRIGAERIVYLDDYTEDARQMYYAVSDDDGETYGALVELNTTIDIHHPSILLPA